MLGPSKSRGSLIPKQIIPFHVRDAKTRIVDNIVRGRNLLQLSREIKEAKRDIDGKVASGVNILDAFVDLSGHKRTAKTAGRWWLHSNLEKRKNELDKNYEVWFSECINILEQVSTRRKRMNPHGNSGTLVSRFSKSKRYVRTESRLRHGIAYLESLSNEPLILNSEIRAYVRSLERQESTRKRSLDSVKALEEIEIHPKFGNIDEVLELLNPYPNEKEAIQGAITTYENGGPDSNRQSLSSCRNALEKLVCTLSEEKYWGNGLPKLVTSKSKRKIIRNNYEYLSEFGSHGPAPPTDVDTEWGIGITIASIKLLLKCS
jgi:hypothetical protein